LPVEYRGFTLYCQRKMTKKIILASRSPRRKKLLEDIGLDFTIDEPIDFDEIHPENRSAHEIVKINAIGKAESVANRHSNAIILGVDTVGAFEDHILEKPKNHKDAVRMLKMLEGDVHQVLTCICLIDTKNGKKMTAVEETNIEFIHMTDEDIEKYLAKGESHDKAAAYAAQGIGSIFVKSFDGDYFNVVGLPMYRLNLMLREFDIELLDIVK
jgi:septum formation protein